MMSLAAVFSCSSDESTGVAPLLPGAASNPEYQSVSAVLGSEAFSLEGLHWHSVLEAEVPGGAARLRIAQSAHDTVVSVTMTIDSATGWIVIDAIVVDHKDTAEVLDSVRFYRNSVVSIPSDSLPVDSMTAVDVHIHGHLHANDSSSFVGVLEHSSAINLLVLERDPGLATVTYQLNLTAHDAISGTAWDSTWGVCDVQVAADRSVNDLVEIEELMVGPHPSGGASAAVWRALAAHEGCPLSGTISVAMDVDLVCTGGVADVTVNAEWILQADFTGGDQVVLTYSSDGFYWNKTVDCSELSDL